MTYWPEWRYQVCGAIRVKYDSLGGPTSFLLLPTSNELTNPGNTGKRSTFVNGPIYWSSSSGAHPVANHFFAAWQRNGWEAGPLGYPTTDEIVNPDGIGRRQEFQNTAAIYWRLNEAYAIRGAIRQKWNSLGAEQGILGYPVSDEINTVGDYTRFGTTTNAFERGALYWHPSSGHVRHGEWILDLPVAFPGDDAIIGPGQSVEGDGNRAAPAPEFAPMATSDCPAGTYGFTGDKAKFNCVVRLQDNGGTWWNARRGAPGQFGIEHFREDHDVEDEWVEWLIGRYNPTNIGGTRWAWGYRYRVTDPDSQFNVIGLRALTNAQNVAASAGVDTQQFGLLTAHCYIPKTNDDEQPIKIQFCPEEMPPGGPFRR